MSQDILVISPVASHPPQNGARRRIYTLLHALKARGHRIHFAYTACERIDLDRVRALMAADWDTVEVFDSGHVFEKTLGADYGLDDWIRPGTGARIAAYARACGATHCLANYVFQSRYFEDLPEGVVRILDTHDRLSRRALFEEMGLEPGFFHTTEAEEMRGLARADVVLAIQDEEAAYFARAGRPVVVAGHPAPFTPADRRWQGVQRIGCIAAHNKLNIHALERFLPAFERYAAAQEAPPEFCLAGNAGRHFQAVPVQGPAQASGQGPGTGFAHVSFAGYVEDAAAWLSGLDLVVNPVLSGTGLKIKSAEALACGMPVISTAVGWEGLLGLPGWHDAEDEHALVAAIDRLRQEGFAGQAKLANFSKASFAEYQLNLARNLALLFETPREEMLARAAAGPGYIGSLRGDNPGFVPLEAPPVPAPGPAPVIAHVVNPVRMPMTSDLYVAQPVAFRAMARARAQAAASGAARVLLAARRYPEDAGYLADCFDLELPLRRSAQDLEIPGLGEQARKLPLLGDVFSLEGLPAEVSHVVFTNSDICLQPNFYEWAAAQIAAGHDALVVNRRTLPPAFAHAGQLDAACAALGKDHPGFDCFVASRAVLEQCAFGDTLIGAHLIGRVAFWNLLARARSPAYFPASQLTFHIGDDNVAKGRGTLPYVRHNLEQGAAVARALRAAPGRLADPARCAAFERVLAVTPGPLAGGFDPAVMPRNQVFLHSFFRTGSTYLFRKVRGRRDWTAYYEPFHEDLAQFKPARLAHFQALHAESRFRHAGGEAESGAAAQQADAAADRKPGRKDGPWLFAEYEALMDAGVNGIRGYDRRMSYLLEYPGSGAAVADYAAGLAAAAPTENVFYQFNRTALRQEQMKALFPEGFHIYLRRPLRDIWGSYLSFKNNAVYGFLRNNLALLNFNAQHPLMRALSAEVPVSPAAYTRFFHQNFDAVFHHYTLDQHFLIFAAFWHAAELQAARTADLVLDLQQIAEDRLCRLEAEAALAARRVQVSFSDLSPRSYDEDALLLSPERMAALEARARQIAAEADAALCGGAPVPPLHRTERQSELAHAFARQEARAAEWRRAQLAREAVPEGGAGAVPELAAGEAHGLDRLAESGVLAAGFHAPEARHVWASGASALLRLRTAARKVRLRVHAHPAMAARKMETVVFVNGRLAAHWRLGAAWEWRELELPEPDGRAEDGAEDRAEDGTAQAPLWEIGLVSPHFYEGGLMGVRKMSVCLSALAPVDASAADAAAETAAAGAPPEQAAEAAAPGRAAG